MAEPGSNPILIETTRGRLVESRHRGALAVARSNGETVIALGDILSPIYPRSAIKAFQAIPLIETGAADAYGFGPTEIALSCASHSGSESHVTVARGMLAKAGLGGDDLECGPQEPIGEAAAADFHRSRLTPTALHNNCSGKHSGMLAACRHCGDRTLGYTALDHPHQQRILKVLRDFTGEALGPDVTGVDGCSAPNWAIPLGKLAAAFAALGTGEGAAKMRRATTERIVAAGFAAPEMVAGDGRFCTRAMRALPGLAFVKTGAEGVFCGALPTLGLGFAVKIDDGATRASEAVTVAVLARLLPKAEAAGFGGPQALRNWRGSEVGSLGPSDDLVRVLDRARLGA
jgi:L-asparaginase II